jgi:transaldolase
VEQIGRPNVMIKIPGTTEGVEVVEELTAAGVNVNITLLFSVENYRAVALAYLAGLERRRVAGLPIDRVASVASFFVSRIDTVVDPLLPDGSPLRGRVAIANAKRDGLAAFDADLAKIVGTLENRLEAARPAG